MSESTNPSRSRNRFAVVAGESTEPVTEDQQIAADRHKSSLGVSSSKCDKCGNMLT